MNKFIGLTKRNLLIFFKDKQSVIFSLMTSIIVFVLYLLFLRGTFVDAIQSAMKEAPGLADLVQDKDVCKSDTSGGDFGFRPDYGAV